MNSPDIAIKKINNNKNNRNKHSYNILNQKISIYKT